MTTLKEGRQGDQLGGYCIDPKRDDCVLVLRRSNWILHIFYTPCIAGPQFTSLSLNES